MYKFSNGLVAFDEKTRDKYLEAGYKLVDTGSIVNNQKIVEKTSEICAIPAEVDNENNSNNGVIKEKPRRSKKVSK